MVNSPKGINHECCLVHATTDGAPAHQILMAAMQVVPKADGCVQYGAYTPSNLKNTPSKIGSLLLLYHITHIFTKK